MIYWDQKTVTRQSSTGKCSIRPENKIRNAGLYVPFPFRTWANMVLHKSCLVTTLLYRFLVCHSFLTYNAKLKSHSS